MLRKLKMNLNTTHREINEGRILMNTNSIANPIISPDLIFIHPEATSNIELIKLMAKQLMNQKLVKDEFIDAILQRESEYPTGVPIGDIAAAIPHTDAIYVNNSAMVVSVLKNPIPFANMANPDEYLPVQIVFMLAMKEPAFQIAWLKKLLSFLNNPENLQTLQVINTRQKMADYLNRSL